mmetsp:Transcript_14130/g.42115  ORF Transcript_14130/g.42115 Transcript_14130/m.42115 type:complete len:240 (-) Transcript_14130:128-847(-)
MDDSLESGTNEAEAYAEKGRVLGFLDELIDVFTPSPPKKEPQRKRKDDDDDRHSGFKPSLQRSKSTCEIINGALAMPTPRAVFDGVRVNIEKNGKVLDADRFEELEDGDLFFDYIAWLVAMLSITLWLHGDKLWSFATFWWVLPGCVPSAIMLPYGLDPRGAASGRGRPVPTPFLDARPTRAARRGVALSRCAPASTRVGESAPVKSFRLGKHSAGKSGAATSRPCSTARASSPSAAGG